MDEVLREDEVTPERIEALAKQARIPAAPDEHGTLVFREEGRSAYVRVDTGRKIIIFFNVWALRPQFSLDEKLQYVNGLNNGMILVRFAMPRPEVLWCDYQLLFEGGISPVNIINTYKLFASACRAAVAMDKKDMVV
jgi:hypothetical protein